MSEDKKVLCSGYRRCRELNPNKKCRHEEPHDKITSCNGSCGPAHHRCYTMDLQGHVEYVLTKKELTDG